MRNLFVLLFVSVSVNLFAQQIEFSEAVRRLVGETEAEALDANQMELFNDLYHHPADINKSTRSYLESTGLFTPFQVASLIDYRDRHGYIQSIVELASVDGFTEQSADCLKPFIIFDSQYQKMTQTPAFSGDMSIRYGYKKDNAKDVTKSTYGLKARIRYSDKLTMTLATTEPYDSLKFYPTVYSASMLFHHRAGKIVVGDFNARFGQGLCVWNTASFSSLNSPSSFMKRPSGIAAVNSFTGSTALTGFAADMESGRWKLSAILSLPGLKKISRQPDKLKLSPMLNLTRFGRYGHVGCTHYMVFSSFLSNDYRIPAMRTSFDGSCCIKGVNLFGEGVYDWVENKLSILTGSEFGLADNIRMAAMVRYLPVSNEHGAAVASEVLFGVHEFHGSVDALNHPVSKSKDTDRSCQIKGQISWICKINAHWMTKVRFAERFRTWGIPSKMELRTEVISTYGNWKTSFRADAVYGCSLAGLAYLEGGYLAGRISAYLRCGIFHIDNWDDRIYVYERDAPGNFNVPSFYKRGLWVSGYIAYRPSYWCKLYLRGIFKKPGNAELKLYSILEF